MKSAYRFLFAATLALFAAAAPAAEPSTDAAAEFARIVAPDVRLVKLAGGMRFIEGPAWLDGGLVFSDIPANELRRWTATGGLATYRRPSGNANGNTVDRAGRLITCEHSGRRVAIREADGTLRTLANRHDGRRFNSPNDVVVKSDGTIWFTDPSYGLAANEVREQPGNHVYRLDPETGTTTIVARDFDMPNGLCFSPDERWLYISDSGRPRHVRVFAVQAGGTLAAGREFCRIEAGVPDGLRCDAMGRLYVTAADGIHVFRPDGTLLGKIAVPETTANLCFGGREGKTLFITASTSLYSIELQVAGTSALKNHSVLQRRLAKL